MKSQIIILALFLFVNYTLQKNNKITKISQLADSSAPHVSATHTFAKDIIFLQTEKFELIKQNRHETSVANIILPAKELDADLILYRETPDNEGRP